MPCRWDSDLTWEIMGTSHPFSQRVEMSIPNGTKGGTLRLLAGTTCPMWVWSLWPSNGQVRGHFTYRAELCFVLGPRLSHRSHTISCWAPTSQLAAFLGSKFRCLEQERTNMRFATFCNPTSLCQKSSAIVVLPCDEEIHPQVWIFKQHGIAAELWFHQRTPSEKQPDSCSTEIASADVPWPEPAALSGAWKDKNIMRSMLRSWWETTIYNTLLISIPIISFAWHWHMRWPQLLRTLWSRGRQQEHMFLCITSTVRYQSGSEREPWLTGLGL